jgi:hypothetical protein
MPHAESLHQRAESLVGSRPSGGDALAWFIAAEHYGDQAALGAVAAIAARPTPVVR